MQEVLVFVALGAAGAFLVKKLFLHDFLARRRPHVPVGKLVRKKRTSERPPGCH
jgi:hypothetical protein